MNLWKDPSVLAKTVAALSSFVSLQFTWEQLIERLSPTQREAVSHPLVYGVFAFGSAYSACGDEKATLYAIVLGAVFISMYEDLTSSSTSDED